MTSFTLTRRIEAPLEFVFDVFTDFAHAADHIQDIRRLDILTDGPIGAGTRLRETRRVSNKEATEELEITAFEPDLSYTVACQSYGCRYESTFHFVPNGRTTEVHFEMRARAVTILGKLVSPLVNRRMARALRTCVERALDDLQTAIRLRLAREAGSDLWNS